MNIHFLICVYKLGPGGGDVWTTEAEYIKGIVQWEKRWVESSIIR